MPDSHDSDNNDPIPNTIDPEVHYIGYDHDWHGKSLSVMDFHERHLYLKDGRPTIASAPSSQSRDTSTHPEPWDIGLAGPGNMLCAAQTIQSPEPAGSASCQSSLRTQPVGDQLNMAATQLPGSSSTASVQPPSATTLRQHGFSENLDAESLRRNLSYQQQCSAEAFSEAMLGCVESLAESHKVTKKSLPDRIAAFPPRGAKQG
jgi:hypothetical protein